MPTVIPWQKPADVGRREAGPLERGEHGDHDALALVVRGRGHLGGDEPSAMHHDGVGEGAAHVHAHQGAFRGRDGRLYHRGDSTGETPSDRSPSPSGPSSSAPLRREPPRSPFRAGCWTHRPSSCRPGPPNGDLSLGLAGWDVLGRDAPQPLPGGRGVIVAGNVTLVSPPLEVPPGAQTLRVALAAPGGGGLVAVRARPVGGGPEVALALLEPGAARRSLPVGVAALAGSTVRIVIDPVPALGTRLEVRRVGPVTAPLVAVGRRAGHARGGGRPRTPHGARERGSAAHELAAAAGPRRGARAERRGARRRGRAGRRGGPGGGRPGPGGLEDAARAPAAPARRTGDPAPDRRPRRRRARAPPSRDRPQKSWTVGRISTSLTSTRDGWSMANTTARAMSSAVSCSPPTGSS